MVELPYGRTPYPIRLDGRDARVLQPPPQPALGPLDEMLDEALARPIGSDALAGAPARVTVIVSDATRVEPRAAFLDALRRRMPRARWTIAVATGTHGPARLDALGIASDLDRADVVNHDGQTNLVTLGTTARGTPVRVHRCVLDADLVIATGCIRPHYFAGFGAGVKAIFPGLGETTAIRINHRLKTEPLARPGNID